MIETGDCSARRWGARTLKFRPRKERTHEAGVDVDRRAAAAGRLPRSSSSSSSGGLLHFVFAWSGKLAGRGTVRCSERGRREHLSWPSGGAGVDTARTQPRGHEVKTSGLARSLGTFLIQCSSVAFFYFYTFLLGQSCAVSGHGHIRHRGGSRIVLSYRLLRVTTQPLANMLAPILRWRWRFCSACYLWPPGGVGYPRWSQRALRHQRLECRKTILLW